MKKLTLFSILLSCSICLQACQDDSNGSNCTSADNKCLDNTTASVCVSGRLETQACTGDKPVCKDGACVSENNTGCTTAEDIIAISKSFGVDAKVIGHVDESPDGKTRLDVGECTYFGK